MPASRILYFFEIVLDLPLVFEIIFTPKKKFRVRIQAIENASPLSLQSAIVNSLGVLK